MIAWLKRKLREYRVEAAGRRLERMCARNIAARDASQQVRGWQTRRAGR